ncbi:hypothetical protein HanPI659440_Chr05g0193871 [Helianthus annuus]|nr:hypothetical protein HanPI659440_Chr05g0193871 [Helianthus annuus]
MLTFQNVPRCLLNELQSCFVICCKDVVSVTADSSAVEIKKDSVPSLNGKRTVQEVDVVNVGELSSNVRRTQKKLSKVNN